MSASPAATADRIARSPTSLIDLLACPQCHSPLRAVAGGIECDQCARVYPLLSGTEAPILLPAEPSHDAGTDPAGEIKAHVRDRFAMIDQGLPAPFGSFAMFLNLGYVANDAPQRATRGPRWASFNAASAKLLFEVLGASDLDGRVTVELGTGRGGGIRMIQQCYRPRALVGLDLSPANIGFCAAHHEVSAGGFVVGDAESLPFGDGTVDVVLNLESSHYYPHLLRFFDEVHRVLAPGGELLYGDVLPAATFETVRPYLRRLGFIIADERDITENVLLSCSAVARLRQDRRYGALYTTFTCIPGSPEFHSLRTGATRYLTFTLHKQA